LVAQCVELLQVVQWHETLVLLFGMLAEFPGAADDLAQEIAERTKDSPAKQAAASLFIRLLVIDAGWLRRARAQTTDLVFSAWIAGELRHLGDLRAFFSRFSGEFEQWARERLEGVVVPDRADAERVILFSFGRMGDLLWELGASGEAWKAYEKALEIAERLVAREPERADYLR